MRKVLFLMSLMAMFLTTSCLDGDFSSRTEFATVAGTITTTNTMSQQVTYQDKNSSITIEIDESSPKLNITFNGVKFAETMPPQEITIPNVSYTFTISEDGITNNTIFDTENIIPTIGGIEYEDYMIKRVWGCIGNPTTVCFEMATMPFKVEFTAETDKTTENQ